MSQRHLAILLWAADLQHPERAATPFVMAQAAAALDVQVELYFTAQTVYLLTPQAASTPLGFGPEARLLSDYLASMQDLGIPLYACSMALHAAHLTPKDLSPCCTGLGGAVQFMARCTDPSWESLVF